MTFPDAATGACEGLYPHGRAAIFELVRAKKESELEIESPCISLCRIDPDDGLCEGCGRSPDEIRAWKMADEDEKIAILNNAARRRAQQAAG